MVAALRAGQPVDPVHGQRGKQRSVHNTYFTLPVRLHDDQQPLRLPLRRKHNWLVLVVLMLAGALIRLSFVLRHKALAEGQPVPWRYAIVGTLMSLVGSCSGCCRRRRRAAPAAAAPPADVRRGAGDRRAALR